MKNKNKILKAMHSIATMRSIATMHSIVTQIRRVCAIAIVAIIGFCFPACDDSNGETHTHQWGAWKSNATQHWKECSCGDKTQIANHTGNPCGVCSYDSSHTHSYSDTWLKDATQHWKECSCGDKTQIANHTGNPCVCGHTSGHSHSYSDTWLKDTTQHWKECSCGDKTQVANHSGNPCGICGYESGHSHSYSDTWSKDATQHWKECSCADKTQVANHTGNPCVCGHTSGSSVTTPTWTAVANSTFGTDNIRSIAFGGNKFVAPGFDYSVQKSKFAYSTDGVTWTSVVASSLNIIFRSIAWGNDKFVAGGMSNDMAFSSDGITWTAVMSSPFNSDRSVKSIAYGSGKFVAVAGNDGVGEIAYSTDGITWTAVTNTAFGSTDIYAIAWGE